MKDISLCAKWIIKAPLTQVFDIMTDFEKWPEYFPKVAQSIRVIKQQGDNLEMEATVKSFGKNFPVKMKTRIIPQKGFISDNISPEFGTSGHEELLLSESHQGTVIDYNYHVFIHKRWLRIVARPLIGMYSMKYWQKAVIDELKKGSRNKIPDICRFLLIFRSGISQGTNQRRIFSINTNNLCFVLRNNHQFKTPHQTVF